MCVTNPYSSRPLLKHFWFIKRTFEYCSALRVFFLLFRAIDCTVVYFIKHIRSHITLSLKTRSPCFFHQLSVPTAPFERRAWRVSPEGKQILSWHNTGSIHHSFICMMIIFCDDLLQHIRIFRESFLCAGAQSLVIAIQVLEADRRRHGLHLCSPL